MPPFQAVELKSGWRYSSAPIDATRASESDRTGRPSTRRFQTLSDGKTVHGACLGAGLGAGAWVGFGAGLGTAIGASVGTRMSSQTLEPGMAVGPIAARGVGPAIDERGPPGAPPAQPRLPSCPL